MLGANLTNKEILSNSPLTESKECNPANCYVLVIEDNHVNQLVLKKMLIHFGCQVDIANNGEEGVEAALSKRYDVIMMDCQMPVMDGFFEKVKAAQ